jgi:hypothetical protein
MTADIVCNGELCNSVFTDRKELFKMKRLNEEALFCFGCVTQINKEDGWEMKSRDSLARYEKITGEEFEPYEDPFLEDDPKTDEQSATEELARSLEFVATQDKAKSLVGMLGDLIEQEDWQWQIEPGRTTKQLIEILESLSESKNTKDS